MKKKKAFPKKTALLLTAAAVLLAGSGIGSARAALTYYSENYLTQISTQDIGVTLNEKGEGADTATAVSYRNYEDNGWNESGEGTLLAYMSDEDFTFAPGKSYTEELSVTNSGSIKTYVRVIITKSWQDENGAKAPDLDPDWIELNLLTENSGWIVGQTSKERTVLYYTSQLDVGETTNILSDKIRINNEIAQSVQKVTNEDGSVSYVYDYDGYQFTLDAEVDAVQTHNAAEAIKSAWGVTGTLDGDGNITSITAE